MTYQDFRLFGLSYNNNFSLAIKTSRFSFCLNHECRVLIVLRYRIPNSFSWNKSDTFLNFFCVYFCTCHSVFKIECCDALVHVGRASVRVRFKLSNVTVPVQSAITPNHGLLWISVRRNNYSPATLPVNGLAENDKTRIHNSRFLGRMSVRTVVLPTDTGEQVSLYRPSSEIYVQENIFIISFNHCSTLVWN